MSFLPFYWLTFCRRVFQKLAKNFGTFDFAHTFFTWIQWILFVEVKWICYRSEFGWCETFEKCHTIMMSISLKIGKNVMSIRLSSFNGCWSMRNVSRDRKYFVTCSILWLLKISVELAFSVLVASCGCFNHFEFCFYLQLVWCQALIA